MIDRTNILVSFGIDLIRCSIETLIMSSSIDCIMINITNALILRLNECTGTIRMADRIFNFNHFNALGSTGYLIEPSISIVFSLIDHLIL
jgi:hypothetical protein